MINKNFLKGFTKKGSPLLVENSAGGSSGDWGNVREYRMKRQAIASAHLAKKKPEQSRAVKEETPRREESQRGERTPQF